MSSLGKIIVVGKCRSIFWIAHHSACNWAMHWCRRTAQRSMAGGVNGGGGCGAAAALWSLHGLQLFFCTGHFCEFAGLQYTAGAPLQPADITGCGVSAPMEMSRGLSVMKYGSGQQTALKNSICTVRQLLDVVRDST